MKKIFGIAALAAFWVSGCGGANNPEMGAAAQTESGTNAMTRMETGTQTGKTNLMNDATPNAPGSGAAVGGDVGGAGTAPLRRENAN